MRRRLLGVWSERAHRRGTRSGGESLVITAIVVPPDLVPSRAQREYFGALFHLLKRDLIREMNRRERPLALDLERRARPILVIHIPQLAHDIGQMREDQPHLV